ncbi:MAG: AtpZ/AtpI family protein [Halieaceae bacterium]|nr:AtpZ/AtpI family protein [Halieaceae bacterium]MCP5148944.1 AtpZ/AtpI family protein [Pseudomonadales bacterium]MCP5165845.1 AtpZ/AtpI family protein [Pseudomonadales bacterium]MCP5188733.1 AtpZ/AtpI family protein [Pseudomonadales bacterium]
MKPDNDELARRVEQQAQRMQRAERDRPTLLAQTVYLGSLGLMFILPVIAGVYLGHWLDGKLAGYSMRWTLSLLFAGLVIGGFNVYWLIRSQD